MSNTMYTINKNHAKFLPPCCMNVKVPVSTLWASRLTNARVPCNTLSIKNCLKTVINWCSASKRRFMGPTCQKYITNRNLKYFVPLYINYCNYGDLTNINSPCRKSVMKFNRNDLRNGSNLTKVFDTSINNYCKKRTTNVSLGTPYVNDTMCSCYVVRKKYGVNIACSDECRLYGYKNANVLRSFSAKPCVKRRLYSQLIDITPKLTIAYGPYRPQKFIN